MAPVAGNHLVLVRELPDQSYGPVMVTSSSGTRPPWTMHEGDGGAGVGNNVCMNGRRGGGSGILTEGVKWAQIPACVRTSVK